MCGVAKEKRVQRQGYTFEQAQTEIDRMGLAAGDILEISGGEPTAYNHLDSICTYAHERWGARVLVLSHGRHLKSKRLAERLTSCHIERFVIPVFSFEENRHDYLTA